MQELIYVTAEDGFVILENASEERFKVKITDGLREATRQLIVSSNSRQTSPKQIQALYRAGKTDQEISQDTGEKIEFVQMFTPAVQSELDYVTERVQLTEFVFGNQMMPFSEIVQMSFSEPNWRSFKQGANWFVKISQGDVEALWKYEPRVSLLEPQNEVAKKISAGMQDAEPLDLVFEEKSKVQAPIVAASPSASNATVDQQVTAVDHGKDAEVYSLLDEIRERRAMEDKHVQNNEAKASEPETRVVEEPKTAIPPKPASAKGRSSLPSWDEIIFGSNADS